ncbi:MAG: hypothetical protein KDG89_12635 [Geminicoccaceae bacterium]|nr:hypothetical protein [Geminicoccaceae bacterium]
MAYNSAALAAIAYADGFTLWHYRTEDLVAEVDNAGYFNEAATMLRQGDFVLLNTGMGRTPTFGLVVVTENAGGLVDVSNVTQFGAIDSD